MTVADDPFARLAAWLADAERSESHEPAAMTVATVGADGRPSLRVVLLRGLDERGLVFYTNLGSRKAQDIAHHDAVALCLHWKSLARQVRVEGRAALVTDDEADAYFAGRPRDSQIGAWASKQSQRLEGRFELEKRVARYAASFGLSKVPRPEFWSGYRVVPDRFEFWEDRPFRLHERTVFERIDGTWATHKLFP